jgi:hypothetical protein
VLKRFSIFFTALSLFYSVSVFAYERDTHLRVPYILQRACGIGDEASKYLAYGIQNVDQTMITSAMLLSVQRGLMHFTGTPYEPVNGSEHGSIGIFSALKNFIWTSKVSLAERNHAVGSMLIYMGLVRGDLQLVAAGLHVKQDTYGHAGFSSLFGHIFDGHNPDRAFLEQEKYEDMIRSFTRSCVQIRQALPKEFVDIEGALKYLNKYAPTSFLKRPMTAEDLDDPAIVSGVLNSAVDLKQIFGENMFKNYHYKILALRTIYEKWKKQGAILTTVSFNDLFTEELLQDSTLDTSNTIRSVLVSDLASGFLQNQRGQVLIDVEKVFGAKTKEEFDKKLELETREYEVRLREYLSKKKESIALTMQLADTPNDLALRGRLNIIDRWLARENIELSYGSNLDNLSQELDAVYAEGIKENQDEINKAEIDIISKYDVELKAIQEQLIAFDPDKIREMPATQATKAIADFHALSDRLSAINLKMNSEIRLMKADMLGDSYFRTRAKQLAEFKTASEISDQLTKDLVPRAMNQYIKQQFEGNTPLRQFEVAHKDEAYRRYIWQNFGVNWVSTEGNFLTPMLNAMAKFRELMKPQEAALKLKLQIELEKVVNDSVDQLIGTDAPSRESAQRLKWDFKSNFAWFVKLARYIAPGFIPFYSDSYVRRIYTTAQASAKLHEIQDIPAEIAAGNYQVVIQPGSHIEAQVRALKCPEILTTK